MDTYCIAAPWPGMRGLCVWTLMDSNFTCTEEEAHQRLIEAKILIAQVQERDRQAGLVFSSRPAPEDYILYRLVPVK